MTQDTFVYMDAEHFQDPCQHSVERDGQEQKHLPFMPDLLGFQFPEGGIAESNHDDTHQSGFLFSSQIHQAKQGEQDQGDDNDQDQGGSLIPFGKRAILLLSSKQGFDRQDPEQGCQSQ